MENKINYQRILDAEIEKIKKENLVPKLLIHSCCAPCSSYVLEYLTKYFDITVFYYNPNISTREEFIKRSNEQKRLISELPNDNNIKLIIEDYDDSEFYNIAKGLENEPECGKRCQLCYRLRLEKTAEYAIKNNYDYFTTTLTISPLKNSQRINKIGEELSEIYRVKYLFSDFKKNNGYKRSCELSNQYNLYRQNFCGCIYSINRSDINLNY